MKKIQLTNDKRVALVDNEDYEWLMRYNWYADSDYVKTGRMDDKISMHRMILGLERYDPRQGDHIDFDTFNNQRFNLRIATNQQNQWNNRQDIGKSGFRGVCKQHKGGYQAYYYHDKKRISLGTFPTPEEAAWVRDKVVLEVRGKFAVLNFPGESN